MKSLFVKIKFEILLVFQIIISSCHTTPQRSDEMLIVGQNIDTARIGYTDGEIKTKILF